MRLNYNILIFIILICFSTILYHLNINYFEKSKYKVTINPIYNNTDFQNKKNERNVVIGILALYSYKIVEPYFNSLRKTGYKGEVICFTLDKSLHLYEDMFKKYNIHCIIISNEYPYYLSTNKIYPIREELLKKMSYIPHDYFFYINIRHFLLYFWLLEYSSQFSYIFTSDIRDSIFQRSPFEWNYKKGVYFTHETQHCKYYQSIKCSKCNYNWFFNLNPPKHLSNNTFINAGQIFASSMELKIFLKEYTELMYNIHLKNKRRVETCDQGILNYYVLTKNEYNFPVYIFEAEHGYARVIGLDLANTKEGFEPNDNLTIINQDNTIPVFVHQYDAGFKYGSEERKKKFIKYFNNFVDIK